jgi:transcriptional regulator with GAF, ATPase, and Fis domain
MVSQQTAAENTASSKDLSKEISRLQARESRLWFLLAGVAILSTSGLAFAIMPLLRTRIEGVWPWANTTIVLLAALSVAILLLVTYLTIQHRKTREIRMEVNRMVDDTKKRERMHNQRLHALLNVSRVMGSVTDTQNVFRAITDTCLEIFRCQQASLMLINNSTGALEMRSATGHIKGDRIKDVTLAVGDGVAGWVADKQNPLLLNRHTDMSQYPGLELKDWALSAAMVVPIIVRDELVGVLNISTTSPEIEYNDSDLQALQVFAENAGACIRHAEHVEWMRKTIEKLRTADGQTSAPAKPVHQP